MYIKFCEGNLQYIKIPIVIKVYMYNITYRYMQLFIKAKSSFIMMFQNEIIGAELIWRSL